jgi:hypothetical protein
MRLRLGSSIACSLLSILPAVVATGRAQQAEVPQTEYRARRERVFEGIPDGILILGSRHPPWNHSPVGQCSRLPSRRNGSAWIR